MLGFDLGILKGSAYWSVVPVINSVINSGPVWSRTNFTRPITQTIAIRDAMWKAHNSGDIEGAEIMSEKFTTYLNRFEAFMKTGVIQDD